MRIGGIIQARTASTRLSKKVLMELPFNSGITVCNQVIRRSKKSKLLNTLILATTKSKNDLKLVKIAKCESIPFYRGSEKNVLSRYYQAALESKLDIIVRLVCDNPCTDWNIIDETIKTHLKNNFDYTNSTYTGLYPLGTNVEVFSFEALEIANRNAKEYYQKEHVTPYFYHKDPRRFRALKKSNLKKTKNLNIRLTLDTLKDYALLCEIFDNLYPKNKYFNLTDIKKLFIQKPWLQLINNDEYQKKYYE